MSRRLRPPEKMVFSRIGRKYPMPWQDMSRAKAFSNRALVWAAHQVPLSSVSDETWGVKIEGFSENLSILCCV
jgi:hypothetical protein